MRLSLATRILIGLLAVVIAYFFLVEEKQRKAAVQKRQAERKLFLFPADSVQRFVLLNPNGERIDAERGGDGWRITYPVTTKGDGPTIGTFLGQIAPGRRAGEIADVADLAAYGLDKPFATVILFRRGGGSPDTLYVGDKTPTSANSYVRLGSSKTVLISSEITHNVMQKNLYHLRDKNFLDFDSESVTALSIRNGASKLELAKLGTYWWFTARHVRADRVKVEQYLTQLTTAIIRTFVRETTEDLAPYGFAQPDREVTLARGSERVTVSFGKKESDQVYATRTGLDQVMLVDGKLLEATDWNMKNLRARNLAFFDPDSVGAVRYETPDTSVVLRRTGKKWTHAGNDTIAASKSYIADALVRKLTTVTFDSIIADPVLYGDRRLQRRLLTVTVEDRLGRTLDRITIAMPSENVAVGASDTARILGTLRKGAFQDIDTTFRRIGSP